MIRFKPSRTTVAVALSAVVIILAGSGAVASNMGFKLNKALLPPGTVTPGAGGDNWVSIPYNRPYTTVADLCTQLGLPTGTSMQQFAPLTGVPLNCSCGVGTGCAGQRLDQDQLPAAQKVNGLPAPYLGIRARNANFTTSTSAIIVGSHNPTQAVLLNAIPSASCPSAFGTSANIGGVWFSVPYHTTAVTANDLCTQAGLGTGAATVSRQPIGTTPLVTGSCGFSSANFSLVLGEAVKIRRTVGSPANCATLTFIPAHF